MSAVKSVRRRLSALKLRLLFKRSRPREAIRYTHNGAFIPWDSERILGFSTPTFLRSRLSSHGCFPNGTES